MRPRLLIIVILFLLLAPDAKAGVSWVVKGHGFGHGVGMSQYGAYGYAKHGKGYRFILNHYYRGVRLATLERVRVVRVLVGVSRGDIDFSGATSACGRRLDPTRSYTAHRAMSGVTLSNSAGRPLANCGRKLRAKGDGRIEIARIGTYRGALEVVPTSSAAGSLNAVNALGVDQYVKGVIANESPASWPQAALRAQAVAARSYALSVQVDGNGFDLFDNASSQVYEGLAGETAPTNRAANATRGQVLMHGNEIAETYFSACSGGHTESVQNVFFGRAIPYLVGVPDPYDRYCPLHNWKLRFSGRAISARLGRYLDGQLKRVVVVRRGASPRIVWARLHGTGGVTKVRGDRLASALGAYDRWLTFRKFVNGEPVANGSGGMTRDGVTGGAGSGATGGAGAER